MEEVRVMNRVERTYTITMLETMKNEYGSVEAYWEQVLLLPPEKIEFLREKYTDP